MHRVVPTEPCPELSCPESEQITLSDRCCKVCRGTSETSSYSTALSLSCHTFVWWWKSPDFKIKYIYTVRNGDWERSADKDKQTNANLFMQGTTQVTYFVLVLNCVLSTLVKSDWTKAALCLIDYHCKKICRFIVLVFVIAQNKMKINGCL